MFGFSRIRHRHSASSSQSTLARPHRHPRILASTAALAETKPLLPWGSLPGRLVETPSSCSSPCRQVWTRSGAAPMGAAATSRQIARKATCASFHLWVGSHVGFGIGEVSSAILLSGRGERKIRPQAGGFPVRSFLCGHHVTVKSTRISRATWRRPSPSPRLMSRRSGGEVPQGRDARRANPGPAGIFVLTAVVDLVHGRADERPQSRPRQDAGFWMNHAAGSTRAMVLRWNYDGIADRQCLDCRSKNEVLGLHVSHQQPGVRHKCRSF